MDKMLINKLPQYYKNNGQQLQVEFTYTTTGNITKADNIPHDMGTDCLQYQIKCARATICKGLDLLQYLATDKATEYVYITKNRVAYIMSKSEYIDFCMEFATVTRESQKNGGGTKMRLKSEGKKMLQYLMDRA